MGWNNMMNFEFLKWLEEQEYDFNYVDIIDKPMLRWEESWFIKSVHDAAYPDGRTDDYAYRWSNILMNDFTITYNE
jgi:hypothetical protein